MKAWSVKIERWSVKVELGHAPKDLRKDFSSSYVTIVVRGCWALHSEICRAWFQWCLVNMHNGKVKGKTIWLGRKYRALMVPDTTTELELPSG